MINGIYEGDFLLIKQGTRPSCVEVIAERIYETDSLNYFIFPSRKIISISQAIEYKRNWQKLASDEKRKLTTEYLVK